MLLVLSENITMGNGHKLWLERFRLDFRREFPEFIGSDHQGRCDIPILTVYKVCFHRAMVDPSC